MNRRATFIVPAELADMLRPAVDLRPSDSPGAFEFEATEGCVMPHDTPGNCSACGLPTKPEGA